MRLKSVQIRNFRSIEDSNEFDVGDVTCLVGKNEAGKSAVLQALHFVRPYGSTDPGYDKIRDYPRRFAADFNARHPDGRAVVAITKWVLEPDDKEQIANELGADFWTGDEVTISRGYGYAEATWGFLSNEAAAVQHLVGVFKLDDSERRSVEQSINRYISR